MENRVAAREVYCPDPKWWPHGAFQIRQSKLLQIV